MPFAILFLSPLSGACQVLSAAISCHNTGPSPRAPQPRKQLAEWPSGRSMRAGEPQEPQEEQQQADVMPGLGAVLAQLQAAAARRSRDLPQITPRLVCVSKVKPVPLIIQAYNAGQRHFGENYANELYDKANDPQIIEQCKDIMWHYIGHLQTNKINKVLSSPGLFMVETVHSEKLADNLNKQWPKYWKDNEKLKVLVQINTSGEDAKNGVQPSEATKLVEHVIRNCPNLEFNGLMTIGQYGYDVSQGPNPDFVSLSKCRQEVCKDLNLEIKDVELSMGMSTDFEHAIEMGATTVRVGSSIFGARPPKK